MADNQWHETGLFGVVAGFFTFVIGKFFERTDKSREIKNHSRKVSQQFELDAFNAIRQEASELREELKYRIEELEAMVVTLRTDSERHRGEYTTLLAKYTQLAEEYAVVKARAEELQHRLDITQTRVVELQRELDKLQGDVQ